MNLTNIGQVVSWGERCRIKHLPTRLYLAIVKEENGYTVCSNLYRCVMYVCKLIQVTLKRRGLDKTDLDTVFRLFPVIEVSNQFYLFCLTNTCLNRKTQESSLTLMLGLVTLTLKLGW